MRFRLLPLLILVLTLSACGDDEAAVPGGADADAVAVIDDWSTKLRSGDVDAAAELFAIPSLAQNGPTLEIGSVAEARLFNASLPCGAVLIRAEPEPQGGLVLATFRLTERPGPGRCGAGAGATAQTDFLIEDGEIVEWRRVGAGEEQAPSSEA